jgi:Ca2+-binding EF-hand superfamily protein
MLSNLKRRKLVKLFTMYDACNSGFLKFADYEQIVARLATLRGFKIDSNEYQLMIEKYGFQWIKMRGDIKEILQKKQESNVSLEEWLVYHEIVLQESDHQKMIRALDELVFNTVDIDRSNNLDLTEWKIFFSIFNIPVVYADESFQHIDQNGDGSITREELFPLLEEFYYSEDENAVGNKVFGPI